MTTYDRSHSYYVALVRIKIALFANTISQRVLCVYVCVNMFELTLVRKFVSKIICLTWLTSYQRTLLATKSRMSFGRSPTNDKANLHYLSERSLSANLNVLKSFSHTKHADSINFSNAKKSNELSGLAEQQCYTAQQQ